VTADAAGSARSAAARIAGTLDARIGPARVRALLSLGDQGVVSLTTFLTGVLLGRLATKEELGLYALGFSALLVFTSVQQAIVSTPYMVNVAKVPEADRAAYAGSSLLHQLALAALAAALLACGALAAVGTTASARLTLLVAAAALPFTLARDFARQLLFARLRFGAALALDAITSVVLFAVLGILASRGLLTARSVHAALGAACGVGVLAWWAFGRRSLEVRPSRAAADFRANWTIGGWSLASGLAGVAGGQLYPWLLAGLRGTADAGAFAACASITFVANPLVGGLGNMLAPRTFHAHAARGVAGLRLAMRQATLLLGGVMCVVTPTLLVAGGFLLKVVYGARYQEYGLTVGILSLAQAIEVTSWPLNHGLLAIGRVRAVLGANLMGVAMAATLGAALVRGFGPVGVALALLLANAVSVTYRWRQFARGAREPLT
jgi:O-antigen/teichoic acid export membrane protein